MFIRTAILMAMVAIALHCGIPSVLAQTRSKSSTDMFGLERGRAGQFALGMTVAEAYELAGKRNLRLVSDFPEGIFQLVLEIRLAGFTRGPALTATITASGACGQEYSFSGIEVYDSRFRTRNGLGVGSTLGDLQRQYPGAEVGNIDADGGPSVVIEQLGLTFAMDVLRSYTSASRVKSVWVYPLSRDEQRARLCPDQGK